MAIRDFLGMVRLRHFDAVVCMGCDNKHGPSFNMLADGIDKIEDVSSDSDLIGFDVDVRNYVLKEVLGLDYTVKVVGSYGELNVRTRQVKDRDIGWAPFYQTRNREQCSTSSSVSRRG